MHPAPSGATLMPAVGHYRFDPTRTAVRFHTRHLFGLGAVDGTVRLREGWLSIADPAAAATLHAVLDAASFETGNARRDTEVRSATYLDVARHPDITLDVQQVRQRGGGLLANGVVTAHGVAVPVDLAVEELRDDGRGELTVRASTKVDRYAHRVTAGRGLAARWLTVEVTATARRVGV
jgi:polyisoprenoid-binding protein YceI